MHALALLMLALRGVCAAEAEPPPLTHVTFALSAAVAPNDADVLLARLADWDSAWHFDSYAVPYIPAGGGGSPAAEQAMLAEAARLLGPARLIALCPTVGLSGWEAGGNPVWLPLGGHPSLLPCTTEEWRPELGLLSAGAVAHHFEGVRRVPTGAELAKYLDQMSTLTIAQELWLPAAWFTKPPPKPDDNPIGALTPARVARFRRVVLVDVGRAAYEMVTGEAKKAGAVTPERLWADGAPGAVAKTLHNAMQVVPVERLAVDLSEGPLLDAAAPGTAADYLRLARRLGVRALVVRGRLDTPQQPRWQAVLDALPRGAVHREM